MKGQIKRAAVSITSNIAEGFDRDVDRESTQFHSTAKGSASEVKPQPYTELNAGYLEKTEFGSLYQQARAIVLLLGGFIKYLQQSELRGRKFKSASRGNNPEL